MKKNFLMALLLIPLMSFGQNRVQTYIDQQMKTDSLLINAVVGILAVDQNGREIASWNPDMPLLTASTMKTITTGLGFAVLGPDYRFSTRVAYDGRIENGILHGIHASPQSHQQRGTEEARRERDPLISFPYSVCRCTIRTGI